MLPHRLGAVTTRAGWGAVVALSFVLAAGPAVAASGDPAPPAADGDQYGLATFGISAASGERPDARSYVMVGGAPGSVIHDSVAVVNQSNFPLDLDVYAADAINDEAGAVGLPPRSVKPSNAGSWITVDTDRVTVPAQSSLGMGFTLVPITVSIPKDAEPGDHLAGVIASLTSKGSASGDVAANVDLEQRTGERIYITVPGEIRPGLSITGAHVRYKAGGTFGPGAIEVEYTLVNSGNVRYGVEPTVRANGLFGLGARTVDGTKIEELLPGSEVKQSVTLTGVWPTMFQNVTIAATAVATTGRDDPGIGTVHVTAWTWAWSWIVAIILVLVAVTVLVFVRRRRSVGVWPGQIGPGGPGSPAPGAPPREHAPTPESVP